jgi:hypothetical protein
MRLTAGVERYTLSNKSGGRAEPTNGDQRRGDGGAPSLPCLTDSDQVRFGVLCGLKSDISRGPLSADFVAKVGDLSRWPL